MWERVKGEIVKGERVKMNVKMKVKVKFEGEGEGQDERMKWLSEGMKERRRKGGGIKKKTARPAPKLRTSRQQSCKSW